VMLSEAQKTEANWLVREEGIALPRIPDSTPLGREAARQQAARREQQRARTQPIG
jgi:hypothetical protein